MRYDEKSENQYFYGGDMRIDLQNWMQIDFVPDAASARGQEKKPSRDI